ncbi:DUF3325 domain-containing protein [Pseudomonas sp. Choline-3u-10]|jgi:hypothetical protein|uniref:DUF3325 family protein n=1 Tax=Pseudomonadaceae TaxID=135621 RepID=UPI000617D163|nr:MULTISPECIES: DUF3325 family protein [Pseudomonadaceae]MAL34809.1 DUF3325 domain-containing protein [Pseudomonas sp.]MBU0949134.1 DUF3325 family protein [Gammaproteobacteria bacterium]MBK3794021.1 DUF3325 family protein [Stutzerimonas stutzeri]MBK3875511.1 DUF3325 family protein [Stutzerimonas stutzeri]PKG94577.1 DUF3325 domain-containing protein [Pseudomonas sp. Choline-3u-10]|tara:strand:+ start:874 stop:1221 length:348 start_codon:yes stop_codon:yes gene_type:complete
MPDWLGSVLAFFLCYLAFALLALCQQAHRKGVDPSACIPTAGGQRMRALCATLCLFTALALLLAGQGGGFGTVLWVLLASAAAFSLALTLAWKPAWLRPLLQACCLLGGQVSNQT